MALKHRKIFIFRWIFQKAQCRVLSRSVVKMWTSGEGIVSRSLELYTTRARWRGWEMTFKRRTRLDQLPLFTRRLFQKWMRPLLPGIIVREGTNTGSYEEADQQSGDHQFCLQTHAGVEWGLEEENCYHWSQLSQNNQRNVLPVCVAEL